jgi:hypothetical protein
MEILNELVKSHFNSQTNDNDIPCDELSTEDIKQLIGSQCEEGVLKAKYSLIDLLIIGLMLYAWDHIESYHWH